MPIVPSIECRALPPTPQVMKVCLIVVLGHKYETCTQSALMGHYSVEKMVSKKHVHLNSIEVVLRG